MLDGQRKTAVSAPPAREIASPDTLRMKLESLLQSKFCLKMLPAFTVVVEGTTDRDYLIKSCQLCKERFGEDLLAIPATLSAQEPPQMHVVAPGKPGNPNRGGIPQMVRLAEAIQSYVFTLEMFRGLVFVFDHDDAGIKDGQNTIIQYGFKPDQHSITLDPKYHVNTSAKKQITIEDLLSLEIQKKFFERGNCWCSADYEAGRLVRYKWGHNSKSALRDYACQFGRWEDFIEVARILKRIRTIFGLPTTVEI